MYHKYIGAEMIFLVKISCVMTLFLSFFSCGENDEKPRLAIIQAYKPADSKNSFDNQELNVIDRKIIKEGSIDFETTDIAKTRNIIDEAIKKLGGYISEENEYTQGNRISQNLIVRIPADKFDELVSEISKGVKRFERKSIQLKDVTEEYLDIELRLKIKKETENRFRELLTKANTVNEILSIEKQKGELRADIESIEGRLKYLQNQISFSSLSVTFYELISTPVGFSSGLGVSLQNGWNNFIKFLIVLVNAWPFLIIGLLVIIGLIATRKKRNTLKAVLVKSEENEK